MQENSRPLPPDLSAEIPSSLPVNGEPVDVWDQINKYGTYEVQDTTDTDNTFPAIGPHQKHPTLPLPDAVLDKQRPTK